MGYIWSDVFSDADLESVFEICKTILWAELWRFFWKNNTIMVGLEAHSTRARPSCAKPGRFSCSGSQITLEEKFLANSRIWPNFGKIPGYRVAAHWTKEKSLTLAQQMLLFGAGYVRLVWWASVIGMFRLSCSACRIFCGRKFNKLLLNPWPPLIFRSWVKNWIRLELCTEG